MDAAEKGEVIDVSDKSRKCGLNFAAPTIVKAIPLHMIFSGGGGDENAGQWSTG